LKAEDRKAAALDARVTDLEKAVAQIKAGGGAPALGGSAAPGITLGAVLDGLRSLGVDIAQETVRMASAFADTFLARDLYAQTVNAESVNTQNATVGTAEAPTGITLFDKATGKPYCFAIENGAPTAAPGACARSASSTIEAMLASTTALNAVSGGIASSSNSSAGSQLSTASAAPQISVNGNNPSHIQVGRNYADLGAVITGPQADLNLGIHTFLGGVEVSGIQIDTSSPATYTIDYVVTDAAGLAATSTRTVIVEAPQAAAPTASSTTAIASSTADTASSTATTASSTANTASSTSAASTTATSTTP